MEHSTFTFYLQCKLTLQTYNKQQILNIFAKYVQYLPLFANLYNIYHFLCDYNVSLHCKYNVNLHKRVQYLITMEQPPFPPPPNKNVKKKEEEKKRQGLKVVLSFRLMSLLLSFVKNLKQKLNLLQDQLWSPYNLVVRLKMIILWQYL